ncbi:hypothetical protein J7413_14960 [Shimia sp. R10_1]|uniref:hypothetical protein n=1 Tax=Shimia sp. R10_1 TaxID=2821095 RepID=UPI001ADBBFAF|nr:hypothetical protein [Shimia sp. R10_1]MBO9474848.1 hypothetical protein [Shimia sp. R10_1]
MRQAFALTLHKDSILIYKRFGERRNDSFVAPNAQSNVARPVGSTFAKSKARAGIALNLLIFQMFTFSNRLQAKSNALGASLKCAEAFNFMRKTLVYLTEVA